MKNLLKWMSPKRTTRMMTGQDGSGSRNRKNVTRTGFPVLKSCGIGKARRLPCASIQNSSAQPKLKTPKRPATLATAHFSPPGRAAVRRVLALAQRLRRDRGRLAGAPPAARRLTDPGRHVAGARRPIAAPRVAVPGRERRRRVGCRNRHPRR